MIVKIQLPLASNEPEPLVLIYDEKKAYVLQSAISPPLRAIMKGRPKAYFNAVIAGGGSLEILEEVPEQPW